MYWLKIAALVDVPANYGTFDPFKPQSSLVPVTQWVWHNRDYTIQNTLASPNVVGPPFPPGEAVVGTVGANTPVWHFQDDSVAGDLRVQYLNGFPVPTFIQQANMLPQKYIDGLDDPANSIPGAVGIGKVSKDLAFELYTVELETTS